MPVPPTSISAATMTSQAIPIEMRMPVRMVGAAAGRITRKAVRLGPSYNGHQVVLEGLSADDKVVVEGNLLLERILAEKD